MNLKNIKLNGRFSENNGSIIFYNVGSGLSFKMNGNSFDVHLNSIFGKGYFYIIIDRDFNNKIKVLIDNNDYKYTFKDRLNHLVDIVKVNESNDNIIELTNLSIDGELLTFDESYNAFVKVFGDSTIAGFGILAKNGSASIHNSDGICDFCYHALYKLGMDCDIFAASGYGLAFSAYTKPKTMGIFDFFDKVAVHQSVVWDDRSEPDLLIISLGCNDNSYIEENTNKQQLIDEYKQKYKNLIDSQMSLNSALKVLMVYGTLNEENAYYLYEETYSWLKTFYKNIYIHKFSGDSSAVSNHAHIDAHNRMTEELKKVISEIL